ncbi:TipJ family phage tail tip protein [Hydrocarboniphaga effusa]|uniref:TipJ family phage tail tip protein n=1 Tax=Hydrocarboniphaga effusa TaxID=243629 RepID=UPI003BAC9B3D
MSDQLREVRLYGWLGERYGRVHMLAVKTPSQAVRLLAANHPGFFEDFTGGLEHAGDTRWRVWVGQCRIATADEGAMEGTARICIAPVIRGAIKVGALQTIVGIVLIGAGLFFGQPQLVGAGIAMTAGGVIQMLMPVPKASDTRDKSRVFDGPAQLTAAGNPIPVALGRTWAGSLVASASIHLDQIQTDAPAAIEDTNYEEVGDGHVLTTSSGSGWGALVSRAVTANAKLDSRAYSRLLDVISVGPIRGLVDGLKSIYLDDVPIQSADGTYNFEDVFIATRLGTQDQPEILGYGAVENEVAVGVVVLYETPVVRTVIGEHLTAIRVRLRWNTLMRQTSKGKIRGTEVKIAIDLQADGGSYVEVMTDEIRGQSSAPYETEYRITVTPGAGPWNVRVRRLTEDADGTKTINAFSWAAYATVIDRRMRYPRTALVAMSLDSEQFQSTPKRAYHLDGYDACWMPDNYDPDTRMYTGAWSGVLKQGWTNNPAWITYTLLRDTLWGLGRRVRVGVLTELLPTLYTIGRYCDQLVPDGAGGFEPRFTFNTWISNRKAAWQFLDDFVSVFRGMHFWAAGSVSAMQDAPADPVFRFTNPNVLDGRFAYEGASSQVDFSVVIVYYHDPAQQGRRMPVRAQDPELMRKHGYVTKEVDAFACDSRGQAMRLGRAVLAAARFGKVVKFTAGKEGAWVSPGDVIEIYDRRKAGSRLSGRFKRATLTSVTLDAPVTLVPGQTYTVTLVERQDQPITRTVTTPAGTVSVLKWAEPLDAVPRPMSLWMLGSDAIQPTLWRVTKKTEGTPWRWSFVAVQYAPEKYAYIDSAAEIQPAPVTSLYQAPGRPTGLVVAESQFETGNAQFMQVVCAWRAPAGSVRFVGGLSADSDNPIEFDVLTPAVTFDGVEPGDYVLTVQAVGANGKLSPVAKLSVTLDGIADPPLPLESIALDEDEAAGTGTLRWDAPLQLSVRSGGAIELRFWPSTIATANWSAAQPLGEAAGSDTSYGVSLMPGTYLARTRAFDGQLSAEIAGVQYGDPAEGSGPLTVTAVPTRINKSGRGSSISASLVFDIRGGTGPATISTAVLSGDAVTISAPTESSTSVTATGLVVGGDKSGVIRCSVTDSIGTVYVDVPFSFYRYAVDACVVLTADILGFGRAALACSGDEIETAEELSLAAGIAAITHASDAWRRCSRITAGEFVLDCSDGAGIPTRQHGLVAACQLTTAHEIAVRLGRDAPTWIPVSTVEPIGHRMVRKLSLGERCFWAGNQEGFYILHHNIKP